MEVLTSKAPWLPVGKEQGREKGLCLSTFGATLGTGTNGFPRQIKAAGPLFTSPQSPTPHGS